MKISNTCRPPKYDIQQLPDGTYDVILCTNITERAEHDPETNQDITAYDYDRYTVNDTYFVNLAARIDADYNGWVQRGQDAEQATEAAKVREYRDSLLSQCDLQHCNPERWEAMSDAEKLAWNAYKQALRDVPAQAEFPQRVEFPTPPADTSGSLSDVLTANQLTGQQITTLSLSDAQKNALITQLGKQAVQMQLEIAALKGGTAS